MKIVPAARSCTDTRDGRTDRTDEANGRFLQFCKRAKEAIHNRFFLKNVLGRRKSSEAAGWN